MHHIIIVIHIQYKFHEIPFVSYLVMAPDGRTDGRTDGHGQTYIPPPSAGDKKKEVGHCNKHQVPWSSCFR